MEFKLPDIGEGVHEGEITKWLVKEGDSIAADQPMVEVMTDKATVEIPSPVAGVVEALLAKEGQTIEVGKGLLRIQEKGKAAPAAKEENAKPKENGASKQAAKEQPEESDDESSEEAEEKVEAKSSGKPAKKEAAEEMESEPAPEKQKEPARKVEKSDAHEEVVPTHLLATPATRKLARDLQVDLSSVRASGPNNRLTKVDVQMAYEGRQAATPRSSHPVPVTPSTSIAPRPTAPTPPRGELQKIPLKGIRKKIAEAMSHSKHTAAHFTYVDEVDMTEIARLRKNSADEAAKRNVKLTFLPFILKGLVPALMEFPFMNASLDDERQEILLKGDYNIGIATDTPNGLMVPVLKGVDRKNIWELAQEIHELSEKARSGKIVLEDLRGGTFTVTNAGSIGGCFTAPVINHPEVAILGVNSIKKRPVVKDDQIVIRDMMYLSMSVDHRVVDGADAARFMNRLIYFLSDPMRLVFA